MLRYAISSGELALAHRNRLDPQPPRDLLLAQARSLAAQQVDFFLLREPGLPGGLLASLARDLLTVFAATSTRILIHSRADVAAATGAHGVHLPSSADTLTPAQVASVYATAGLSSPLISLSCHTPADIERARTFGPTLILFGPVFGKTIAGQLVTPPTGLEALSEACCRAAPIPVLALGGITEANTPACLAVGSAGIAAIRLFQQPGTLSSPGSR